MFRRIAAACALTALVAMGVAAPAAARPAGAAAARADGHDAQAIVPARRVRERAGATLDGRPDKATRAPSGLVRSFWLAAPAHLDTPVALGASLAAAAPADGAPGPALASRTSRGPPARS